MEIPELLGDTAIGGNHQDVLSREIKASSAAFSEGGLTHVIVARNCLWEVRKTCRNWSQMPMVTAWSAHSDDDSRWMTASLISCVLSLNPKHIWGLILCHLCCRFVTWSLLLCKCNHGRVIRLITQTVMYQSDLFPKYSQSQSLLGSLSDLIELKCYCLGNEYVPHNLVFFMWVNLIT